MPLADVVVDGDDNSGAKRASMKKQKSGHMVRFFVIGPA
jgi:hypothetical protein